jgi:hypothetical protein
MTDFLGNGGAGEKQNFYLYIDGDSNFIQFHYCLIFHQGPSKFYIICNGYNFTVFDGLSNDNEII